MESLDPLAFFDLSSYKHAELFEGCSFVWEPLLHIKDYLQKQKLGQIEVRVPENVYLINPEEISIGAGTVLEPGAYIKGPCILGKNCVVRHGAYIRGDFIAGEGCVIGHDTEIKNAVFLNNTHAAHFAYVGDSILGNDVNLGAGTKCANLKFNREEIFLTFKGSKIPSGLRKFGAVFGDGSQTGCNSVTNPGTLMGKGSCSYPCTNFGGIIPANQMVKPTQQVTHVPFFK